MAIIKAESFIHEYKLRSKDTDISSLSGRKGRGDMTYFINKNILETIDISENDSVLDIGCGDATLLKMIDDNYNVSSLIGLLPTNEEITRLKNEESFHKHKENIDIYQAFSHILPVDDNSKDKIIINGVLILLDEETVNSTLQELSRVSKQGSTIYIGETPILNEYKEKSYGNSITKWLIHSLFNRGFKYSYGAFKSVFRAVFLGEQMVLGFKVHYFLDVDSFIKKLKKYDFELLDTFPSKHLDINGQVIESSTRQDYILKKI